MSKRSWLVIAAVLGSIFLLGVILNLIIGKIS